MAKLRCTSAASPRLPDQGGFCLGYCAVPDFVHDMASIECRAYACYFSDVDSEPTFIVKEHPEFRRATGGLVTGS